MTLTVKATPPAARARGPLALLPTLLTVGAAVALLFYGPIPQPAHYHAFADERAYFGLPNFTNVVSNAGFALVGLWGFARLWPMRTHPALAAGWPGYALFLLALVLTAAGSSYYHWAPDNDRLVWDRLPIALACAGLLAGMRADTRPQTNAWLWTAVLATAAVASVVWWHVTEQLGHGDLRPYLLLQGMPLVVVPLWQAIGGAPRADRWAVAGAVALYLVAKLAEVNDQALFSLLGVISGHTLKHLLATAAAAVLVGRLVARTRES